jgi:TonB-linked SusC/RagA family outer membrane protein
MKKLTAKTFILLIAIFCSGFGEVFSQINISGNVMGPDGTPAIGVTVIVKGTTTGTITDITGKYSISATDVNAILTFSFIGYETVEMATEGRTIIDIKMAEALTKLDEVVVVGYGTVKKSDLTGSITAISTKDMKNTSVLSVDQALQGRAAGVLIVNNSGAPGSPVSVKIRGIGTFGNTDPLYIVDGMPIKDGTFGKNDNPSGIEYLNPNDIESMQVLKDASAAAIYGTRGSNGVIIITTKRGKSGKMKVDLDNYVGMQTLPGSIDMLNAQQYETLYNTIKGIPQDPAYTAKLKTTDWIDGVTNNAVVYNNQVSISGGNENTTVFLSANNYRQNGIVLNSKYERQSFRLNTDSKVNDWLKVGESMTLMQSYRDRQTEGGGGVIYSALKADPTQPMYDSTGNWQYIPRTGGNPKAQVDLFNYFYKTSRIQGSVYAEIEFLKNLKYKFNAGLDRSWSNRQEFFPTFNYSPVDQNDIPSITDEHESWNNWLAENLLSYSITKGKHKIDLLAGYTAQAERKESLINMAQLLDNNPDNRYLSLKTVSTDVGGDAIEWALLSQLARLNYAFSDKYLVTASVRRDGSSRFGANKKYGVFPSWSAAWKISSEEFFKNNPLFSDINLLKLRFGWGQVGNQNIMAYAYNGSVSKKPDKGTTENGIYMGSTKALQPFYVDYTMANPEVGWETNTTSNFGLDAAFLKDKVSLSFDMYDKTTSDFLLQKPLPFYFSQITPTSTDWGKPYVNLGEINNKGMELSVTFRNYDNEFTYEISANMSKNFNKVISLDGGQPSLVNSFTVIKEGMALGTFYGYVVEGIFQDSMDVVNHAYQKGAAKTLAGDFKFKDINKDGKVDAADQTYLGNAFPDFNYGITINMGYKGFDLSIFGQGVSGNLVYNQLKQNVLYNYTLGSNVSTDLLNAWGNTLANGSKITNTSIPRLTIKDTNGNNAISDYYLEDGSYFRIKSISIGYTLKGNWLEAMKMSNLRLYCTLQNIFTFTKYTGFNPEIGQSNGWNSNPLDFGVDAGAYPQPKIYMVGLNVSF